MSNNNQATYSRIKANALEAYYDFCRDSGLVDRWSHRQILGRIDYEYENTFTQPVEQLMLAVVQLILQGGWHPEAEPNIRRKITNQIAHNNLKNLLKDFPETEIRLFLHDLHILNFI